MTGEWPASKPYLAKVCEKVCTLICNHRLRIYFQWVLREENKEADGAYRAVHTAGGAAVVLDNTGSL